MAGLPQSSDVTTVAKRPLRLLYRMSSPSLPMKVAPASDSRGSLIGCAVRLMVTPGVSVRGSTGSSTLSLGEAQADADRHSSRAKAVVPSRFMFRFLWRSFSPLGETLLFEHADGKGGRSWCNHHNAWQSWARFGYDLPRFC